MPRSQSSLDRVVRAGVLAGGGAADPIARGFEILAAVAEDGSTPTRWSIVYDLGAREVHFRTDDNRAIRRLRLAGFDFSCRMPVRMLDVATGGPGDVGAAFVDYTPTANRALIETTFAQTPSLKEMPVAARDAAGTHPERTSSCAASD